MNTQPLAGNLVPPLDSFGIPAPAWVFVFLMNLTLTLHFLLLGYVFTTSLLGVFWSMAPEGSASRWMLRRAERLLPVMLSFAITLGVAPLLFVQVLYHSFFYPANILIGHQWFGIVPVLIAVFYLIYILMGGKVLGRTIPRPCEAAGRLAILAGILYVLVTHTTNALLLLNPPMWPAAKLAGTTLGLTNLPVFWPRLLHNIGALLAIGGFWLMNLGFGGMRRLGEGSDEGTKARTMGKVGALVTGGAVAFELFTGMLLFAAESKPVQGALFSARPASILWIVAMAMGLLLLLIALVELGLARAGGLLHASGSVLLLTLGGMFAGREAARQASLAPYFQMSKWDELVHLQASSLTLFLVLFVLALVLVGVMAWWLRQAMATRPAETAGDAEVAGGA